jgi:hypothetical protein
MQKAANRIAERCQSKSRLFMTEVDRMRIVENMFPDWKEHLNDGKVIDQVLDRLTCQQIVLNRCSRPGCNHVARPRLRTCMECAAKAADYRRIYLRRKTIHAKPAEADSGHKPTETKNLVI